MNCEYWQHVIGRELDAGFDGGEFSGPYHAAVLEELEPCGRCAACADHGALDIDAREPAKYIVVWTSRGHIAKAHTRDGMIQAKEDKRVDPSLPYDKVELLGARGHTDGSWVWDNGRHSWL